MFVNASRGDFRLRPGAAAVGRGDPKVFPDRHVAQLGRQSNGNLVILERLRPVEPGSALIAYLEEVAS